MKRTLADAALDCAFANLFGPLRNAASGCYIDLAGQCRRCRVARRSWVHGGGNGGAAPKSLSHSLTRHFRQRRGALHQWIPTLARHEIIVELARIAALVQDGHTNVAPTRDPQIGFTTLPVKLYFFEDGLFVRAAHRSQRKLAGSRVVRIGRMTPDEAYARVRELVGRATRPQGGRDP